MVVRAAPTTPVSQPHTRAWLAFEENLGSISHMVFLGGREIRLIKADATRLDTFLSKRRESSATAAPLKLQPFKRFLKRMQTRIDRFQTATLWQVVMLVTCVEAYFQDVLCAAAKVDPELMSKSEQAAAYAEVIAAISLDALADDLRARWARGWLSDGGPTRWISRLERIGARGYQAGLAARLELIWGIRHAVVHAAGAATADFVKCHPGVVKKAGDRIRVSSGDFGSFLDAAKGFMEPTDQFFLSRCPSLRAAASTGPAK